MIAASCGSLCTASGNGILLTKRRRAACPPAGGRSAIRGEPEPPPAPPSAASRVGAPSLSNLAAVRCAAGPERGGKAAKALKRLTTNPRWAPSLGGTTAKALKRLTTNLRARGLRKRGGGAASW